MAKEMVFGWAGFAVIVLVMVCLVQFGALGVQVTLGKSGSQNDEAVLDINGETNPNITGIRIKNLSDQDGTVTVNYNPGSGLELSNKVQDGFQLLDGTLEVGTALPDGQILLRARVLYDRVRAGRIRQGSLRLMRLGRVRARWFRSTRFIRRTSRADIKRIMDKPDFILGHHGIDFDNKVVWSVLDVDGQFAIGGVPIPEPVFGLLFMAGSYLVLGRRRKK